MESNISDYNPLIETAVQFNRRIMDGFTKVYEKDREYILTVLNDLLDKNINNKFNALYQIRNVKFTNSYFNDYIKHKKIKKLIEKKKFSEKESQLIESTNTSRFLERFYYYLPQLIKKYNRIFKIPKHFNELKAIQIIGKILDHIGCQLKIFTKKTYNSSDTYITVVYHR
jgi:hypothetical protein